MPDMSTLTSASTLAQIEAAYADNASYLEDASVAKCKAFITACTLLLQRTPSKAAHGGVGAESVEINLDVLQKQIESARQWLVANGGASSGGASVTFAGLEDYRE